MDQNHQTQANMSAKTDRFDQEIREWRNEIRDERDKAATVPPDSFQPKRFPFELVPGSQFRACINSTINKNFLTTRHAVGTECH